MDKDDLEMMKIPSSLEKQALNKKAFTSGSFFVFAQLLARGMIFIVTPFYTRIMTTAQYGIVRTYESWLMAAYTIMSLCLWKSLDVAKQDFKDDYYEYTSSVHTLSWISIILFSIVMVIFKRPIQNYLEWDNVMFFFCPIYVLTYTSMLYLQRRDKQMMKYRLATAATVLTILPGTILSILLLIYGKNHGLSNYFVQLKIIGYYVPQFIGGGLLAILIWRQGKVFFNKKYWRYGLKYSIPLIPEAESVQIMNLADKFMVQKMIGATETGIFALPQTIAFIISILQDSVWNAWIPWLYEKISRKELKDVEKPWTMMMHLFGLLSWILVIIAPEEILILGKKEYAVAVYLVAPMVTGALFRFYSYSYSAIQNYHKNTKWVAFGTITTMVLNVILNYIFIKHISYQAAAYTTLISFMVLLFVQGYLEHRITGMVIVPLHKTALIGFLYMAINILTMLLFPLAWYIRWGIAVTVSLFYLFFMKDSLMGILKLIKG